MSSKEVSRILKLAQSDDAFKAVLFSGSEDVLVDFDLTDSERSVLRSISSDSFLSTERGLETMRRMFASVEEFL
jgi:hypothetical protein